MRPYRIHRKPLKKSIYKNRKKHLWIERKLDRHIQIIALLFFIGFALTISMGSKTLTTWNTISKLFVAIAVVTSFFPKKWFPLIYRFKKEMKALLTLFAITPIITGLVLLLNFTFIKEAKLETYPVSKAIYYSNDYLFKVVLEDDVFEKHYQIRTFSKDDYKLYPESATFEVGKGIFGFKVVKSKCLSP